MKKLLLLALPVLAVVSVLRSVLPNSPTSSPHETSAPTVAHASPTIRQAPQSSPERREITLTAKQWTYEPFRLTAKKGEQVRVNLTTADVPHSFMLPLTPGGEMAHAIAEPGTTTSADFEVVHEPGTYYYWCETPCGEGHSEMHGEFIVEDCPECV